MNVTVLNTSLRSRDTSVSRKMVERYLSRLRSVHADAVLRERDLAAAPVPHLPSELVPVQQGAQVRAVSDSLALSDALIAELERTDLLVLGIAMYNYSISSALKAWFDHVIRLRRTFTYEGGRQRGLLPAGKRAVALVASGGVYTEGPMQALDIEVGLRALLRFIGIDDLVVIRAEGQAFPDAAARTDHAMSLIDAAPLVPR